MTLAFAAAIAAARSGAKICLIEKSFMLGGLGTSDIITIYLPICDDFSQLDIKLLQKELIRKGVKIR